MQKKTRSSALVPWETSASTVAAEDLFPFVHIGEKSEFFSPLSLCPMKPSSTVIVSVQWEIAAPLNSTVLPPTLVNNFFPHIFLCSQQDLYLQYLLGVFNTYNGILMFVKKSVDERHITATCSFICYY